MILWIFLILSAGVYCWWDGGHMLIAEIGFRDLDDASKTKLLTLMNAWAPEFSSDIFELATWADAVKAPPLSIESMAGWHFKDIVYNPENISLPNSAKLEVENVAWALADAMHSLSDPTTKSTWAWNFNIRNIVHFTGDIHCPVHAVTMYSSKFPDGDRGANDFVLGGARVCDKELHFYWDTVGCNYVEDYPLSPAETNVLKQNATDIITKYPKSFFPQFKDGDTDFEAWSLETHNVAVNNVYKGIMLGSIPSETYHKNTFKVAQQQIALAGYRLGSLLKMLAKNIPQSHEE